MRFHLQCERSLRVLSCQVNAYICLTYTVHGVRACSFLCSADSPLLWIRIDPDMSILRKVEFEQADFMWQYQLRYERDVVAQVG